MMSTGVGGPRAQSRTAADGGDAGPAIGPNTGPIDHRGALTALAAVPAIVGVVVVRQVV